MSGRRALVVGAATVSALACSAIGRTHPVASASAAPATVAAPALAACSSSDVADDDDADRDGLGDACELAFARAFAPVLLQDPGDCAWDAAAGRIAGGYVHAVQRTAGARVRVAYLPAYLTDCGWEGAKCLLPAVDCAPHAADSEFIVVEAAPDSAGWRPTALFVSAHCFDGGAADCRWHRGAELSAFEWVGASPVIHVSAGRHANHATRASCDRGHHFLDTCDYEPRAVAFPVEAIRNIGSASAPECVATPIGLGPPASAAAVECPWSGEPFRAWQPAAEGVTSYRRYLDEVAGFVEPIDRLTWLAGCWERRSDGSLMEEQWMAPRGGTMLGMGRVVRDDVTVAHEAMRIEQRGQSLVFVAQPSGQARAEFVAIAVTDEGVVFENAAHDFPQRVVYQRAEGDSLHARIEGVQDGTEQGVDFRMARVRCGG